MCLYGTLVCVLIHSPSNPNADILVTSLVLKHCVHAHCQPRGFHLSWNEHLYRCAPTPSAESAWPHPMWPSVIERSCQLCIRDETSLLLVTCN